LHGTNKLLIHCLNQWLRLSLGTIHWWNELHNNPSNVVLLCLNVLIYYKPSICTQAQAVHDSHIIIFISKIRSVFLSYPFFLYSSSLLTEILLVLSLVSGFIIIINIIFSCSLFCELNLFYSLLCLVPLAFASPFLLPTYTHQCINHIHILRSKIFPTYP
jgi:hypothetical protein